MIPRGHARGGGSGRPSPWRVRAGPGRSVRSRRGRWREGQGGGDAESSAATSPRPVGAVLLELLHRRRYAEHMRIHQIRQAWPVMVGRALAAHSAPLSLRGGRLIVGVSDSVWLQELSFLRETILARVQECLATLAVDTSLPGLPPGGTADSEGGGAGARAAPSGSERAERGQGVTPRAGASPRDARESHEVREVRLRLVPDVRSLPRAQQSTGAPPGPDGDPTLPPRRASPVPDELADSLAALEEHLERVPDPDLRQQIRRAYIRTHLISDY